MREIYLEDVFCIFIYHEKVDFISFSELRRQAIGDDGNYLKETRDAKDEIDVAHLPQMCDNNNINKLSSRVLNI